MFQLVIADFTPMKFEDAQHLKVFLRRLCLKLSAPDTTCDPPLKGARSWELYCAGSWAGWIDKLEV